MFLTHMSFIFSVLAAYLTYVIGVEMAVEERVSVLFLLNNVAMQLILYDATSIIAYI